jgi:hypothetical protein
MLQRKTMPTTLSPKDIAERGEAIYAEKIRVNVEPVHTGKALVIDIESGDYEVDVDEDAACDRIEARRPEGVFYLLRVGYPASLFIGTSASAC